jgi:hypothetical protein
MTSLRQCQLQYILRDVIYVMDVTVCVTDVTVYAERKPNAIVTQGKEAATYNKVCRIL